jgi:hypothetical protein
VKQEFAIPVSGASYSATYRTVATLLCVAVIAQGVSVLARGPGIAALGATGALWFGIALLVLMATYVLMMRATTTIDASGIRQSGLIERRIDWPDVHSAQLAGFGFSRRLVVRSGFGMYRKFFGGTSALVAAFERIAAAYPAQSARS